MVTFVTVLKVTVSEAAVPVWYIKDHSPDWAPLKETPETLLLLAVNAQVLAWLVLLIDLTAVEPAAVNTWFVMLLLLIVQAVATAPV